MTVAIVAGLGSGVALLGLVAGWRPATRTPALVLRDLDRRLMPRLPETGRRPDRVLGRRLATTLEQRGLVPPFVVAWARAAGTAVETLCAEAVLGAVTGLVLPAALSGLATAGGVHLPVVVPVWSSLLLGTAGAMLPFLVVRSAAVRARRVGRAAVAGYLDLVVLCLAGGMGIEGALHAAAGIAEDEFSAQVAASLELARDAGETPWDALSALGDELGVTELGELAAAVRLAGTEGARVRSTLGVKAASIRRHELADAEAEANAVTERLFLPGVFLLVGFLLFVGYPAVARITGAT